MRLLLLRLVLPMSVFAAAFLMTSCDPGEGDYDSPTHHHTVAHKNGKPPKLGKTPKKPGKVYKTKPRRR